MVGHASASLILDFDALGLESHRVLEFREAGLQRLRVRLTLGVAEPIINLSGLLNVADEFKEGLRSLLGVVLLDDG
jgi:hypothetical protein